VSVAAHKPSKLSILEIAVKHLKAVLVGALTLCPLSLDCLAAAPPNNVPAEVVKFADLDLTRPAGAEELYRRIRHAARDVCEPLNADHYDFYADTACSKSAIARAIRDVGAPLLTEHHRVAMD
jgi:UrcA family protein